MVINAYDEYGIGAAGNAGRFRYAGSPYLPELNLGYHRARMYRPTLGRFLQTDPIGYGDGLNMYAYVGADPVNGVDPSGLEFKDAFEDQIVVYGQRQGGTAGGGGSRGSSFGSLAVLSGRSGNNDNTGQENASDDSADASKEPEIVVTATKPIKPVVSTISGNYIFAISSRRSRGERNWTAKPDGTNRPYKRIRAHPSKPGWIQYKDQNGKTCNA